MTEDWKQWEGQVVNGEFHLHQYLGSSDHSAVFLTEFKERGFQKAAIKLIPADPEQAEHRLSRLKLAANLSHPHLIQIFRMGRSLIASRNVLYIVMEYADEDLSQILPQRALTPAEARDMLGPVLDAIAYLHGNGFVHGRVKPSNIMAVNDQIRVSSDGLCLMGDSRSGKEPMGAYDPPEAASGMILPAGDVWALGMTLTEALTQRLPIREQRIRGELVLPVTMPEPIHDIAQHCLRWDPQHRWKVSDIAMRLDPASVVPQEQTNDDLRTVFAKRRYLVPAVAVGLALIALLSTSILLNRRSKTQRSPSTVSTPATVQPNLEQMSVPSKTGQPTEKIPDLNQGSSHATPLPDSLRSGAGTSTTVDGLVGGEVLHQVLPDVPQKARDTIRGKLRVSVRVAVDQSGRVVDARLDSPGQSRYFANIALQAARGWEFVPSKTESGYVPSEWILRFEFDRTATKVFSVQTTPER